MHRAPDQVVALERARWLAELTEAIVQAQKLAWQLGFAGDDEEALELYSRLETMLTEVKTLRFDGFGDVRREIDPAWLEKLIPDHPWVAPQSEG